MAVDAGDIVFNILGDSDELNKSIADAVQKTVQEVQKLSDKVSATAERASKDAAQKAEQAAAKVAAAEQKKADAAEKASQKAMSASQQAFDKEIARAEEAAYKEKAIREKAAASAIAAEQRKAQAIEQASIRATATATREAQKTADAAERAAEKASSAWKQHAENISRNVGIAFTAAGAAITGAMGFSVKSAVDFQAGLSKVATLGVTDLKGIESAIDNVAVKFGVDMKDGINAAYDALSSGVTQAQIPNVLAQAAMAAAAGVTDLNTAIKLGTSVTNAFGGSMDNMGVIFDQAFIAAKVGVTTFEELAASVGEVAPTMAAAKLTTDEMFASVAALTLAGLSTSKAANSMNAALSNIIKPSSEASKLAQQLGLDFSVTALSAKGLAGFLNDVKVATGGDVVLMGQLFGSTEALAAMLALTGNQAKAFSDTLALMKGNTGATQEAFTAFAASNPSLAWSQLSGELAVLSKTLGYALLPALYSVMETITPVVNSFAEWAKANPDTVASLTMVVTAVGGLMLALGPLLIALPGIVAAFEAMSFVLGAVGTALGVSALAVAGWAAAIVAAVAAAGAAIWYFWDEISAAVEWGAGVIMWALSPVIDAMKWISSWVGGSAMSGALAAAGGPVGAGLGYTVGAGMPATPSIAAGGGQGFAGGGNTNNTANVNFNMGGVSVANDRDARNLSKTLATQMRTELRGLGYAT